MQKWLEEEEEKKCFKSQKSANKRLSHEKYIDWSPLLENLSTQR